MWKSAQRLRRMTESHVLQRQLFSTPYYSNANKTVPVESVRARAKPSLEQILNNNFMKNGTKFILQAQYSVTTRQQKMFWARSKYFRGHSDFIMASTTSKVRPRCRCRADFGGDGGKLQ